MRKLLLTLYFTLLAAGSAPAAPTSQESAPSGALSKSMTVSLGDMVALSMTQFAAIVKSNDSWSFSADVIAAYDPEQGKILVSVYGVRTSVDDAKTSLEYFRTKVFPTLATHVQARFRLTLTDADLTLAYINRAQGFREIVRRQENRYLVNE